MVSMTFAGPSHKKQAVKAVLWRALDLVCGRRITLFRIWLLDPEDFGIVSLDVGITAIPSVILTEGFGTTLVQKGFRTIQLTIKATCFLGSVKFGTTGVACAH